MDGCVICGARDSVKTEPVAMRSWIDVEPDGKLWEHHRLLYLERRVWAGRKNDQPIRYQIQFHWVDQKAKRCQNCGESFHRLDGDEEQRELRLALVRLEFVLKDPDLNPALRRD